MTKKALVIGKHGTHHIEGAYAPFMVALASCSREYDTTVFLIWDAVELAQQEVAKSIQAPNSPSLYDMIRDAIDMGARVYICDRSAAMRNITTPEGLVEGVQFRDAFELIDLVDEADVVLDF